MFSINLLADLPEPRDDEPSSLRNDIFDELTDHLQCAFRREVLKDGDAQAAQRRALDRFGDPKQLARRLWRQAMWSRIMRQRIVSGLQWMVAFAAMLLAGAVFWQQSRMFAELRQAREEEAAQRDALAAMIGQLQLRAEAAAPIGETADNVKIPTDQPYYSAPASQATNGGLPPMNVPAGLPPTNLPGGIDTLPPVLTLKFVQETENGPPVTPAMLSLIGSSGQAVALDSRASVAGGSPDITIAHSIEPDLYELTVLLNDGQQSARPLSIRDEQPRELTIICPAPRKKAPVAIAIEPLPDKLQKEKFDVSLVIWAAPVEVGHVKWVSLTLPGYRIAFDGQTGLPTAITTGSGDPGEHRIELRDLPADERRAFLPVGNVNYRFEASRRLIGAGSTPIYNWPDSSSDEDRLDHTVGLDDKPWKVAMSKEYLEKLLSAQESTGYYFSAPYGTPPSAYGTSPSAYGTSPSAYGTSPSDGSIGAKPETQP